MGGGKKEEIWIVNENSTILVSACQRRVMESRWSLLESEDFKLSDKTKLMFNTFN